MRSPLRDFALAFLGLAIGVSSAGLGVIGIVRDIAAVLPIRSDVVWWLRGCLAARECRESAGTLLAASMAAHAPVLWWGFLAILSSTVWLATLRLRERWSRRPITEARFASHGELRRLTYCSPGAWFPLGYTRRWPLTHVAHRATGLVAAAMAAWAQSVRLPEEHLARHVLVLGLTGAHKTTCVTFPVLLEAAHAGISVVALDLKYGEEDSLARAAPEWMRCGRDVLVFAPLDPVSLRWNPLAGCRTLGEAHRLAALLFDDADATDPDLLYWVGAEQHVCAALLFAIATDGGLPTLERMRALCAAGPGAVHSYVQTHPASAPLMTHLGAYRAMLSKDEAGILQGIASRLDAWSDEAVCRATSGGDAWERIDLDRLRREPVLLIVGVPQAARARLRWLCHLFLRDLASCLLHPRGPREQVRVLQVLEELPAWGPLPGLADHLATFRSRHVSVLATIQSEAQGAAVYGSDGWAAVAANLVTKIYFPSLADLDAERLSRILGTARAEDVARSRAWGSGGQRGQEHRRQIPIPLQRPEELQGIGTDEHEILVRCPRLPPARLWCPPFFARPEYRGCLPDAPPSTADLAVYHHLRHRSMEDGPPWATRGPATVAHPPAPNATVVQIARPRGELVQRPGSPLAEAAEAKDGAASVPDLSPPDAGIGAVSDSAQDVGALTQFAQRLVAHLADRRPTDEPRLDVRGVRRGGRLVEVRVDPGVALRLCGDAVTTPRILRRWAALRWVRRVRPVFVLERRALDALDATLRRSLADACASEAGEKETVSTTPG